MDRKKFVTLAVCLACMPLVVPAIQITEIMYHPRTNEIQNEWVELFNETSSARDIGGWAFAEGIDFVFPEGTTLGAGEYLVVAADPGNIATSFGITNVTGPFTGRLNNSSDHIILFDQAGGIMAEVDYEDSGKWPVAADGAGHSLAKHFARGDPMDPDNWSASHVFGGTPGRANGLEPWWEETQIIGTGEVWRYYKGYSEASTPTTAWRQVGFDDLVAGWFSGATGIGFGDGDDATVLSDMQYNYRSVFCRKTFALSNPADVEQLIFVIDFDDGFVAYLNGTEIARKSMPGGAIAYNTNAAAQHEASAPEEIDITSFKGLLGATNVLAVQVHNYRQGNNDLSFIPRLVSRKMHPPPSAPVNRTVVINEVRFNTSGTQYIELYNTGASPVDVGGHYLSNDPDFLNRFQIPPATVIPGNGHKEFLQSELGFAILAAGERILFTSPSLDAVVDARAVEAGPLEMTEGRWPDGADAWFYMDATTGTANSVSLTTAVVINEIMYQPPSDLIQDEYVELYNAGATTISLAGWRFSRGISYTFPTTATIAPGQYLVVAGDRDNLIARYGLDPAIVWGNYLGRLDDGGEKVRLRDSNNNVADEVRYTDAGHWSKYADGYGSSLELIDPRQDNGNYQAWAPSDERAKVPWTSFTVIGDIAPPADINEHELHFHLMSQGVALIDDIHLTTNSIDYIPNGGFESGIGNWVLLGNHNRSYVTTEDAYQGSRSLKIVAVGAGNPGGNHIEHDASTTMPTGTMHLTFRAKWQYGNPVLVTRCWNNQMPETHILPIPANTGTPGAVNSVYRANMGPVFTAVSHAPVIPSPSDTVTVRARVHDPDGLTSAVVYFKADSDPAYTSAPMLDDGLGGDAIAGDGLYTGQIPTRPAGETVAFYFAGTDGLGTTHSWPTDVSRPPLYRVETAPWYSRFPTYRVILTAEGETDLFSTPHLSNDQRNCTFIFNETDVYYNCGIRLIGSPAHRREGRVPGYTGFKVTFNADEKLHGVKWQARFDKLSNAGYRDRINYHLYQKMGVQTSQVEWVGARINARNESVSEDILPPSKRYLNMFYSYTDDENGQLFELYPRFWFTFDDDRYLSTYTRDFLPWQYWGPKKDPYRWYIRIRNHDRHDDYTSMVAAVDVYSRIPSATTDAEVRSHFDILQYLTVTGIRTVNSNVDFDGRKNAYVYRVPSTGKWQLLPWDCEASFRTNSTTLNLFSSLEPQAQQFVQFRGHIHFYLNAIHEYMAKYFTHAYIDPWIDHYYSVSGGYNPDTCKTFVTNRIAYIQNQLAPYLPPFVNPNITTPDPLSVPGRTADLTGIAPVNASWVRVLGKEYWLDWNNATSWFVTIDVPQGPNVLTVDFLDYDKNLIGTDTITIIALIGSEVEAWKAY